ncbi:MAG: lipopolysaccharide biosynthesis protein, partial [Candidatus Rokuibacteriota bacterium]
MKAAPVIGARSVPALALGNNVSWALFGSVAYAACQWGMLVVLAKLGTLEMTGQFALGLAVGAPVFLLTNLSLRSILATDVRSEFRVGDYLALRLVTVGVALCAIVAVVGVAGYRGQAALVCLLVAAAKAIEAMSDVLHGLMQRHERMDLVAGSMVLRGLSSLGALAAGLLLSGSLAWALVLVALAWALVLAAYDVRQSVRLFGGAVRLGPRREDLARLTRLSLPLGITAMLIALSAAIPRYFVERYRGEEELGLFVAMVSLIVVGGTAVNAVGQSVSPRLAAHYAAGDFPGAARLLIRLLGLGLLLGGIGVAVAWYAGGEVLTLVYRAEFARYVDVFVLIMVAASVSYMASFLGYALTAARLLRVQMPLFAAVAAVALIASATLVPRAGVLGAAQATLVTCLANLVLA